MFFKVALFLIYVIIKALVESLLFKSYVRMIDMRRKDREMPKEFAYMVSDKCEWAVVSMIDLQGDPYCVPLSIVRDDNFIYFHCAKDGFKIQCLKNNPNVCISCVGETKRIPTEFTTEFESAIIRGKAEEVVSDAEKIHALKLLCIRHTPTNMNEFDKAISESLSRTAVWKINITDISGKRKKYDSTGKEMKFGRME